MQRPMVSTRFNSEDDGMLRKGLLTLGLVFILGAFAADNASKAADPVFCTNMQTMRTTA